MTTWYDVLQVNPNASKEVIEAAYRVVAKKYHPDLNPPEHREKYEEMMKYINQARDVLTNDFERQRYDESLSQQVYQPDKFQPSPKTKMKPSINWPRNILRLSLNSWFARFVSFLILIIIINVVLYFVQELAHTEDNKKLRDIEVFLTSEKQAITDLESELLGQEDKISDLKNQMDYWENNDMLDDYNNNVDIYNSLLGEYNNNYDNYESKLTKYNAKVDEYNKLAKDSGTRWYVIPIPGKHG